MRHFIDRRTFLSSAAAVAGLWRRGAWAIERRKIPDVVVLVPGILGSVLRKDGKDLWAPTGGRLLAALRTLGQSIEPLRLQGDSTSEDIGDGIKATALVNDVHLIPGLWKIDGYTETRNYLLAHFDLTPNLNYFEFPYDWRRDNRASAARLLRLSTAWLAQWRKHSGSPTAKLVLVAHSMGGLVSLHFLEQLEGWRNTKALITMGTPFRGSPKAADFLSNGISGPAANLPIADIGALAQTFTSVYQLLPRYPFMHAGAAGWKRIAEFGPIPGIDQISASKSLQFHLDLEAAMERNRADPEFQRNGYQLYPFVGTFQATPWSGRIVNNRLTVSDELPLDPKQRAGYPNDGDGTVPRGAATPVAVGKGADAASQARNINQAHASLQRDSALLTQLEGLLGNDSALLAALRDPDVKLAVQVDDLNDAKTPTVIKARASAPSLIEATVASDTGQIVAVPAKRDLGGGVSWKLDLKPGEYRVAVKTVGASSGVSDVFVVA